MKRIQKHVNFVFLLLAGVGMMIWYFNELGKETQSSTAVASELLSLEQVLPTEELTEASAGKQEITEELAAYYVALNKQLKKATEAIKGDFAVSYLDPATGQQLSINGDKLFHGASTMKVPLAMLISDKVDEGLLKWDQNVKYEKDYFESGTGTIQNDIKESYKLSELSKLSITVSDNIAKNMLYSLVGGSEKGITEIYYSYLQKIKKDGQNQLSANDAARILAILYDGSAENEGYQQIIVNMRNTVFKERLATDKTNDSLAHKIGTYENNSHDIGIFYGDVPYILTVYTNKVTDAKDVIAKLSDLVWEYQQEHYPK